mgnify:CR=1 FL=1
MGALSKKELSKPVIQKYIITSGLPSGLVAPGSGSMAIFLAGFILIGLQPGPARADRNLDVTYTIIWSLAIAKANSTSPSDKPVRSLDAPLEPARITDARSPPYKAPE